MVCVLCILSFIHKGYVGVRCGWASELRDCEESIHACSTNRGSCPRYTCTRYVSQSSLRNPLPQNIHLLQLCSVFSENGKTHRPFIVKDTLELKSFIPWIEEINIKLYIGHHHWTRGHFKEVVTVCILKKKYNNLSMTAWKLMCSIVSPCFSGDIINSARVSVVILSTLSVFSGDIINTARVSADRQSNYTFTRSASRLI